jgi:predicted transcriptional regulator
MMRMDDDKSNLIDLTADIVTAHLANNKVAPAELPELIQSIFTALSNLNEPVVPDAEPQQPAVPVRSSVKHEYIVCLEDGAKLKMLRRYLRTRFNMTPEEYRAKWNLPRDYPMVAPAYAEQRRTLAQSIGLGRKKAETPDVIEPATAPKKTVAEAVAPAPAPKKRGRKPKAETAEG